MLKVMKDITSSDRVRKLVYVFVRTLPHNPGGGWEEGGEGKCRATPPYILSECLFVFSNKVLFLV